jgi:PAS domain S-box-containing protein
VSIERSERLVYLLAAALVLLMATLYALVRRDRALRDGMRAVEVAARERLESQVVERTSELGATTQLLALSADRLRGIFDSAGEGILTTDEDQVIVEANAASAQIFGCDVADLIGAPLERLIPQRFRERHRHSVEAFGAGAERARFMLAADGSREVVALRWNGDEFPIEASISRTEVGGQRLYTVIHRDLTEKRRYEAALQSSRQLVAATFDASSVAMSQIDPVTRRFVAVNPALCALSGYSEAELLAMDPDGLNHPEDRIDPAKLAALLRGEAPYREEKRLVTRDGGIVCVEVTGSVVRDADGRPLRVVGFLQDITARRAAELALRAREERDDPQAIAYEASCLLGEFAQAERVGYAQDDGNGETITVGRNHTRGVPGIEGRHRYVDYGAGLLADLRAGRTVVRPDVAGDASLSAEEKAAHASLQLGATVNVPLLRDSHLQAVFFVHAARARAWRDEEVALFEEVAQRVRADITRAAAQTAERTASARLQAALGSMNDAVLITDAEGRFVEFNDAFASFHRFRHRDECRRSLAGYPDILDVFLADGTPAPLEQWAVPRALRGEVGSSVEYRLRRRDTGETWVGSHSFAPIRGDDGRIVGAT